MRNTWQPQEAAIDRSQVLSIEYQNKRGEVLVYAIDTCGIPLNALTNMHQFCWPGCSGDWPGCLNQCPLNQIPNEYKNLFD